jgi:hypothetical protein
MDAWLLEDPTHLAGQPGYAEGFVLGRLRLSQPVPRWRFSVPNDRGGYDRFEYSPVSERNFIVVYFLMILLSFLIVAATTPLALGEYPANRHSPLGTMRLRRWIFLAIKIALLLPIVFCGSFDLASIVSVNFEPHGFIVGSIVALRWALTDQRKRCPVCLHVLTKPTLIGGAAQTFLEWYGTELICPRGHGLLYVPEIPTSCYSTQRWQYLDPSWSSLFV